MNTETLPTDEMFLMVFCLIDELYCEYVTDYRLCEIQIRTKLQDSWADTTHEFFYKAKNDGVRDEHYEQLLAGWAKRLASDDDSLISLRDLYLRLRTHYNSRPGPHADQTPHKPN